MLKFHHKSRVHGACGGRGSLRCVGLLERGRPQQHCCRAAASRLHCSSRTYPVLCRPSQGRFHRNRWQPAVPGLDSPGQHARRTVTARLSSTGIIPLGYDFLTFLATTVLIVPICKSLKLSPVLGFLFAGVVLEQIG